MPPTSGWVRRILIGMFVVFIAIGSVMLIYGIVLVATSAVQVSEVDGMEQKESLTIVSAIMDIFMGCAGLIGLFYNKRFLLYIIIGIFGASIISNIAVTTVTVMTANFVASEGKELLRDRIIKEYGNFTDADAKAFTLGIDRHQKNNHCCGFANNKAENLFLKSPWHLKKRDGEDKARTVPDSCCVASVEECRYAANLMSARENRIVYKEDCYMRLYAAIKAYMIVTIINRTLMSVMQGACILLTVLNLLSNKEEQ